MLNMKGIVMIVGSVFSYGFVLWLELVMICDNVLVYYYVRIFRIDRMM